MSKATVKKFSCPCQRRKSLAFIAKNNMLDQFKLRLRQCVKWASPCGWGFADTIADIYSEYFSE